MLQELDKKRHLLRLWVSPEDNQPLPDVYVSLGTCRCGCGLTHLFLLHLCHINACYAHPSIWAWLDTPGCQLLLAGYLCS